MSSRHEGHLIFFWNAEQEVSEGLSVSGGEILRDAEQAVRRAERGPAPSESASALAVNGFHLLRRPVGASRPLRWRRRPQNPRLAGRCRKAREAKETRACPRTDDVSEFIPQQQKEDQLIRRGKKNRLNFHTP